MKDLTEIGLKYGTDKALDHKFTDIYNNIFTPLRNNELNILEIGIWDGASMKMLKEYFINSNICGIDIDDKTKFIEERINIEICNQAESEHLNKIFNGIEFDIIIDDGSHIISHQQISLKTLYPRLKQGGIYIVEDLHTSLYCENTHYNAKDCGYNQSNDESMLTTLKKLKRNDVWNTCYLSEQEFKDLKRDIDKIDIYYLNDLDSITGIIYKK